MPSMRILNETCSEISNAPRDALCHGVDGLVLLFLLAIGIYYGISSVPHRSDQNITCSAWCLFSMYCSHGDKFLGRSDKCICYSLPTWGEKCSRPWNKIMEALLGPVHQVNQHHHLPAVVRPILDELCPGTQTALLVAFLTTPLWAWKSFPKSLYSIPSEA